MTHLRVNDQYSFDWRENKKVQAGLVTTTLQEVELILGNMIYHNFRVCREVVPLLRWISIFYVHLAWSSVFYDEI